jgi:hypothetical protein
MSFIKPFKINVPQADRDDLQERLARTRWTDEVEGVGWDYGTNLGYMKELADYWQNHYDWRKQEARLNSFNRFKAEIDGVGLSFIHEMEFPELVAEDMRAFFHHLKAKN